MKPEQLKLYNKYYDVNEPNIELTYIGIDKRDGDHIFLYKTDNGYTSLDSFKEYYCGVWGLNYDEINNNFNLKNIKMIYHGYYKPYNLYIIKPCLKDKLKNIVNR